MANLKQRLLDYLEALSGERLDLIAEADSALPLFLRERYAVSSTRLFGASLWWPLRPRGGRTDRQANTGSMRKPLN